MLSGTGIVGETALFSEYSCIYNAEKRMLNIPFSMKFEYWILNTQVYTLGRLVLSKVSCWVAKQWFGETALFSEYSCINNFESTMLNIQYSWKWLCKEGYIELRQLMSNTAWKCKGLMRNETIGVFKLILLQKSNVGYP